jgi:hypothetical protein
MIVSHEYTGDENVFPFKNTLEITCLGVMGLQQTPKMKNYAFWRRIACT